MSKGLASYHGPISGLTDYLMFRINVDSISSSQIRRFKPNEPHIRHPKVSRETMHNVGDILLIGAAVPGVEFGRRVTRC
jgi:hypothetical protein